MKNRVYLKDLAEKLNLSANTVSRALHDKDDISEKTKEEVRRVAGELGYVPDMVASSLRTSSTKTVAVLFDNLVNPYFILMANQVNGELARWNYRMMIFTTTGSEAILTMDVFRQMIGHRVDGVVSFLRPTPEVAQFSRTLHLPIIVVGREADDLGIDCVFTDDFHGGYVMGEYLYANGHRNIGYLGGPKDIMCNVKRAQGLEKFLEEKGLRPLVLYALWDDSSLLRNIDRFIEDNVDAIFCFNDSIAYSAILYIRERYSRHKATEITGYDNIASQLRLPISLASVGTDVQKMVRICVDRLMDRIRRFDVLPFVACMPTFLVEK